MGLFVALSGVMGVNAPKVKAALADFAEGHKGTFEPGGRDYNPDTETIIAPCGGHTVVQYSNSCCNWDDVSKDLSKRLEAPVLSLHIHDGDFWMYIAFNKGREVDWFNPQPDYWKRLSLSERKKWKGNPRIIAKFQAKRSIGRATRLTFRIIR